MKRSDELRPLSVEHHHGLFQVRQLRLALQGKFDIQDAVSQLLDEWKQVIEPHFSTEESILIPVYQKCPTVRAELIETFTIQHLDIRRLFLKLQSFTRDKDTHLLYDIADQLEIHIRFEERELFPAIEETLDPQTLEQIGLKLKTVCVDYDQPKQA